MTTPKTAMHIDEIIERDRLRREAEGFGHREPILQRKPLTAEDSWWEGASIVTCTMPSTMRGCE